MRPHARGDAPREPSAGRALLARDVLGFLEHFLAGDADLEGNLYVLSDLRATRASTSAWPQALAAWLAHRAFQTPAARASA